MTNTLYLVQVRRLHDTWVFSDEKVGLVDEPFVSGFPEIINVYVPHDVKTFNLTFSDYPFPAYTTVVQRQEQQYDGWWYLNQQSGLRGWLCPALYKYYSTPPLNVYVRVSHFLYTTSQT